MTTLLIISPDYASHLLPLATIGTAWQDAGHRVVVATGPATESIARGFGFDVVPLQLGRGSNPGVIRAEEQPKGEDDALRGFFDATREGMIATLRFQAQARLTDLIWDPVNVARRVIEVVREVAPDDIIVDHLAFGARLALAAGSIAHADVVLGHPTALPGAGEIYGYPPTWPDAFAPSPEELASLRELCVTVSENFTAEWNAALAQLDPTAPPSRSAFEEHGDLLLLNYPEELSSVERASALPPHEFLGSAVRDEPVDEQVAEWIASSDQPYVYVSFGSFLSVRADVLAKTVSAIEAAGLRGAIAIGSADRAELGAMPAGFLAREYLPQVTLMAGAAVGISHGGNNSVTEAATAGLPLVVLPFSTDQFAGAEALERTGFGIALAPNEVTVDQLESAIRSLVALPADRRAALDQLARSLRERSGPARALAAAQRSKTS